MGVSIRKGPSRAQDPAAVVPLRAGASSSRPGRTTGGVLSHGSSSTTPAVATGTVDVVALLREVEHPHGGEREITPVDPGFEFPETCVFGLGVAYAAERRLRVRSAGFVPDGNGEPQ